MWKRQAIQHLEITDRLFILVGFILVKEHLKLGKNERWCCVTWTRLCFKYFTNITDFTLLRIL